MRALITACLIIVATAGPVLGEFDHDEARAAMQAGKIVPLTEILEQIETEFHGQVIGVRLETEEDSKEEFVYKIELLTPQGHLLKLLFDARTGDMFGIGGRGINAARKSR